VAKEDSQASYPSHVLRGQPPGDCRAAGERNVRLLVADAASRAAATIGPWLLNGVATVQYAVIVDFEVALAGSWTGRVLRFGGRARDQMLGDILFGQADRAQARGFDADSLNHVTQPRQAPGGSVRGRARELASRGHGSPRQVAASDN
jgi:hypothetical protein